MEESNRIQLDINQNKYSNLKGEIGLLIAKYLLQRSYKIIETNKIVKAIPLQIKPSYKLNEEKLKGIILKRDLEKLKGYFKFYPYIPDLLLIKNGKIYIAEVKFTSSEYKNKKELHAHQRKNLLKLKKIGFPVMIIYIKSNFHKFDISLENLK